MSSYGAQSQVDINAYAKDKCAIIVDLRSDTVTKPSAAMRLAMSNATVGDDVFGEDPTVNELEQKAADMVGKEAALFVTSGTMGNLIAIMVHCNERGCEAYCGENSHTVLHEQGGAAQIAGVTLRPITNDSRGAFCLETLESKLRKDRLHEPTSRLVIVENPCNGKIIDREWLERLSIMGKKHNLRTHMDGARLWNAAVDSGISAERIVENFHSVTFCLSKGLGAPVGSILCGDRDFIDGARRARKVLGGGMRQSGVLAAAGIVALDETVKMLKDDHSRARKMAAAIDDLKSQIIRRVEAGTNMLFFDMPEKSAYDAKTFVERLGVVNEEPDEPRVIVRALAPTNRGFRLVFHRDITDDMLDAAISKFTYLLK